MTRSSEFSVPQFFRDETVWWVIEMISFFIVVDNW